MRSNLANLWHLHRGVTIMNLGEKRFLFQFYYEIDLDCFLDGSLWTLNNHLLVYHRLREGEDPMTVPLFWLDFRIHVHDLPVDLTLEMMGMRDI